MGIPLGSKVTCTVSGETLKPVECAACNELFVYRMTRKTQGHASNILWLDGDGSRRRATESAQKALIKSLERDYDHVACPGCGMYQANMVRRMRLRWMGWSLFTIGLLWLIAAITLNVTVNSRRDLNLYQQVLTGVVGAAALAAISLPWVWNPNSKAQERIEKARTNPKLVSSEELDRIIAEPGDAEDAAPGSEGVAITEKRI
ncbi:MAG: hypothetical protein ACOYN0_11820 [Phycisphaerales bacterium]